MDIFKLYRDELIHSLWNLLGSITILIIGWAVAILVEVITIKAIELANFKLIKSNIAGKSIKIVIIIFSVMMALEHLNVARITITSTYQILLGTLGLGIAIAAGIAFGLAGKDTASKFLKNIGGKNNK